MTDRITTPFGEFTDADEVVAGLELPDHRIVVTGAASGIGVETARALARTGAEVTLAVRRLDEGERVAGEISESTGNARVRVAYLDLADQASVRAFGEQWEGHLDVLVNNAGVMAVPTRELTPEGWERQFATNHLGHFQLALGLHDALAAAPNGARIVAVSSAAHHNSDIVWDDVHFADRAYTPFGAYGQSKTANVLFAVEASRRWAADGIVAHALMPGGIMTNLQRHVDPEQMAAMRRAAADAAGTDVNDLVLKTAQQGASTSVLLAVSPLLQGVSGGRYFDNCNESLVGDPLTPRTGLKPYAVDPASATRLWDASLAMLEAARAVAV